MTVNNDKSDKSTCISVKILVKRYGYTNSKKM